MALGTRGQIESGSPATGEHYHIPVHSTASSLFQSRWGYDPMDAMIQNINNAPTTKKGVSTAIGSLFNWQFAGVNDIRRLAQHLDSILDPVKRQYASETINNLTDPNGVFFKGNTELFNSWQQADPIKATQYMDAREKADAARLAGLTDWLSDERWQQGQERNRQAIANGTISLERYTQVAPTGRNHTVNAIKTIWLRIFFPDATSEEIRNAVLDIGFNKVPEWLRHSIDVALDAVRRLITGDVSDMQDFLTGNKEIGEARGNILNVNVEGLSNIFQSLGAEIDQDPSRAKQYMMREMVRQLETKMGGDAGINSFASRVMDAPIGAIRTALPFIVGANMGSREISKLINGLTSVLPPGLSGVVESGLEKAEQKTQEEIDVGITRDFEEDQE